MKLNQSNMIQVADEFADEMHKSQSRWDGSPYIEHPRAVADSLFTTYLKVVALLHDVLEDTDATVEDLQAIGFDKEITDAVVAITHREGEEYSDYIIRLSNNYYAYMVKKADLKHNLSDLKGNKHKQRRDKYMLAYQLLDALEENMVLKSELD